MYSFCGHAYGLYISMHVNNMTVIAAGSGTYSCSNARVQNTHNLYSDIVCMTTPSVASQCMQRPPIANTSCYITEVKVNIHHYRSSQQCPVYLLHIINVQCCMDGTLIMNSIIQSEYDVNTIIVS